MDSRKLLLSLFSIFIVSLPSVQISAGHRHLLQFFRPTRLFVFGDSYVDTGNIGASTSSSRKFPYGITFPGKPSGRFSNGRVLTDYTASYLGLKPPAPFSIWRNNFGFRRWSRGINFAFGGTGVFNTSAPFPGMTTQIDLFQKLIVNSVLSPKAIQSSLALLSVSGNDYSFYQATSGSAEGLKPFVISVVNQIIVNVKRINSLGVKKVVVTGLGPLGCLPQLTASSSFSQCNAALNSLVQFHNLLLKQAVAKLNNETKDDSTFIILDVYGAFSSIIQNKGNHEGGISFETPLKPCCFGVSSKFSCGSVDEKGNKKYTLCENPESAFFWDKVHPTQEGWLAAFNHSLKSDLNQLFSRGSPPIILNATSYI